MRILLWHGWLLEGSGSNVYTARVAEVLRAAGHDVLLVCQEGHPDRYPWIDAWGTVDGERVSDLVAGRPDQASGRCVLLRPDIGRLLPVFVVDEYEGFVVKRFVDLADDELAAYLDVNVAAMRAAAAWHDSEVVVAGHAVPGSVVAARALGPGRFVAKIHGSDLEYAMRPDVRYRRLAAEGLGAARRVAGPTRDALRRCIELVPVVDGRVAVVAPGVDVDTFRRRPRAEALLEVADELDRDPDAARGRPAAVDEQVRAALARRDGEALDRLALTYDQEVPDPGAADRLRRLASSPGPVVGSFGKLIPQKGVEHLLLATRSTSRPARTLVVGFGTHRERLQALAAAIDAGDDEAVRWLVGAEAAAVGGSGPAPDRSVTFTGRLDHRYAPRVLAAMDVLVVPSRLDEAFGMVAAEGAAAGALPLVARHSGLAEVAGALEAEVGRPGLFSYPPDPDPVADLGAGVDRLLALPAAEREELAAAVGGFVGRAWSWTGTAARLLDAAVGP